jgi:uncharacterized membrane protein
LRRSLVPLFLLFLIAPALHQVHAAGGYTPESLSLKVFADGVISVEYRVGVSPTLARVNVTVFGYPVRNLEVKDQDDEILESSLVDGEILVNVLGARAAVIGYTTPGLTRKEGQLWGLEAELPVEANIVLPSSATITSIQPFPLSIGIVGETTTLTMPVGNVSIGYIIGVVGTKEHALAVINDAEEAVSELDAQGINAGNSTSLLEAAWQAYLAENYVQAEELAREARAVAGITLEAASRASSTIELADSAIRSAVEAGRTSLTEEADAKLGQARALYDQGDYGGAAGLAEEARADAEASRRPMGFGFALWAVPLGAAAVLLFAYTRRVRVPVREELPPVDLEATFEAYPELRMDEREALRFIASKAEGVFVSELRDRFELPRSSAWRMVRRLEGMGVIETERVGRETFLRLKGLEEG